MKAAEQLKYMMMNKWDHVAGVIDLNVKLYFFALTL
jgi:hypothetical protein